MSDGNREQAITKNFSQGTTIVVPPSYTVSLTLTNYIHLVIIVLLTLLMSGNVSIKCYLFPSNFVQTHNTSYHRRGLMILCGDIGVNV